MKGPPAVDAALLQGVEGLLAEGVVGAAALPDEVLRLLPGGGAVGGAAALDNGIAFLPDGGGHLGLGGQQHGPDQGQVPPGQIGHRGKAADPPLPPEVHIKGLDGVVQMMAQGHLVAAQLLSRRVKGAPPQLGAEGAGVFLFAVVKDHRADVGAADLVGDARSPKQGFQRRVVGGLPAELGVEGDGLNLVVEADVVPQKGQAHGQGNAVLAARYPHQHPVPGAEHLVILDGLPHQTAEPLHGPQFAHLCSSFLRPSGGRFPSGTPRRAGEPKASAAGDARPFFRRPAYGGRKRAIKKHYTINQIKFTAPAGRKREKSGRPDFENRILEFVRIQEHPGENESFKRLN